MDTRCGGLAVRRALQPRDSNVAVAPSTVVMGKAPPKPRPKTPRASRPLPAAVMEKPRASAAACREALTGVAEAPSLGEELERARERRGRLRAARKVTERDLDARAAAMDSEAAEWGCRAEEQRRLVAQLMRLIGMPEEYTPVESLRSREERKRREAVVLVRSDSRGSTSTATPLQGDAGVNSCCKEPRASVSTAESAKRTEIST